MGWELCWKPGSLEDQSSCSYTFCCSGQSRGATALLNTADKCKGTESWLYIHQVYTDKYISIYISVQPSASQVSQEWALQGCVG